MTKLKTKDVLSIVDEKGHVSAADIAGAFDIPIEKACDVLKACWERGLLLPFDTTWFARPINGKPVALTGQAGRQNKEKWYRDEIAEISQAFGEDESLALTVRDTTDRFNIPVNKARKILNLMVELEYLISEEAGTGGAFGRRPIIYSINRDNIASRETDLEVETQHRRQVRKAKAMVAKKGLKLDTTTGEIKPMKPIGIVNLRHDR